MTCVEGVNYAVATMTAHVTNHLCFLYDGLIDLHYWSEAFPGDDARVP